MWGCGRSQRTAAWPRVCRGFSHADPQRAGSGRWLGPLCREDTPRWVFLGCFPRPPPRSVCPNVLTAALDTRLWPFPRSEWSPSRPACPGICTLGSSVPATLPRTLGLSHWATQHGRKTHVCCVWGHSEIPRSWPRVGRPREHSPGAEAGGRPWVTCWLVALSPGGGSVYYGPFPRNQQHPETSSLTTAGPRPGHPAGWPQLTPPYL